MSTSDNQEPIAIIGLDCIFPGAPDAQSFWRNILNKVSNIGDPLPTWNAELYLDKKGATSTQKGGYLKDLYRFNPVEFGIMPSSIDGGEPDQFLALSIAHRTLADAGAAYVDKDFDHQDTGVIIGHSPYYHRGQVNVSQHHVFVEQTRELIHAMIPNLTEAQDAELERLLKDQLPAFNADISPGLVPNVLTGRIANRLNLRGPNYMVDAACASSLLAIGSAIDELRAGRSRMMLAGGVNASLPPEVAIIFTQLGALSNRGTVRPFSKQADGTLLGEGLGMVAMKRESDAVADGDKIYALIRGVGQSSDGRGLGLLTPSGAGEVLAMKRTYQATGIDPASLSLIEAHGTGIRLGDRTEVGAMAEVFGPRIGAEGHIGVGSVKSMISHTIPAAGIASVIKTSLALHHKILPPTLCDDVEPELEIDQTALFVNTEARPWIHRTDAPRRAGVNSFGFGGVNAHAILEEAPQGAMTPDRTAPWVAECCVFAADSADELQKAMTRVAEFVAAREDVRLSQIAAALWNELGDIPGPHRIAIAAKDNADLVKKIAQAQKKLAKAGSFVTRTGISAADAPLDGKLAFMFPGEGSQYSNMLADLAQHFPGARRWLDFWHQMGGTEPRTDIVYPRESELTDEKRARLREQMFSMSVGSEAAFIAGQAMFACLQDLGVKPDVMVGHSSGESSALMAAGVVRAESDAEMADGFHKITAISQRIEEEGQVPTGVLIAVGLLDMPTIIQALEGTNAMIAMENCQQQTILFASLDEADPLIEALSAAGGLCEQLPFDRGYHTPAFKPMQAAFEKFYSEIGVRAPTVPLYSCATAARFPSKPSDICKLAAAQWSQKVRFVDTIREMFAKEDVRAFVEVGSGGKLAAFTSQILVDKKDVPLLIAASNLDGASGMAVLLQLMGQLWVSGLADVDALFEGRADTPVTLDALKAPKPKGMFLDNSIPKIAATPELTTFLHSLLPSSIATPAPVSEPAKDPKPAIVPQLDSDYPFLSRITRLDADIIEAEVDLDAASDHYLQDHILSGPISQDPALMGLPCVPLMASLEIMAEAASALLGRRDLCMIENLASSRWLVLEIDQATLSVHAIRASENTVDVGIWADGSRAVSVRLGFGVLPVPEDDLPEVFPEVEYWAPGDYETYREHIFHGPVFQSIEKVTTWSRTGIEATLSDVSLNGFFRPDETPRMIINPVLFDACTQLTAFWLAQDLGPHFASFPRAVPRIEIYAHIEDACDGLWMRAQRRGEVENGQDGTWNLVCYYEDTPVLRVTGMQNAFSMLPQPYYHYSLEPINGWMGFPTNFDENVCVWDMPLLDTQFWNSVGGVFLRVLGFSTLNLKERAEFVAMGDDLAARERWLMPRVAAKEAVRYLANQLTGIRHYSSDIILEDQSDGSFVALVNGAETLESFALHMDYSQPGIVRAVATEFTSNSPSSQTVTEFELETNL
jgi:acyl transferase domain-containing protein